MKKYNQNKSRRYYNDVNTEISKKGDVPKTSNKKKDTFKGLIKECNNTSVTNPNFKKRVKKANNWLANLSLKQIDEYDEITTEFFKKFIDYDD